MIVSLATFVAAISLLAEKPISTLDCPCKGISSCLMSSHRCLNSGLFWGFVYRAYSVSKYTFGSGNYESYPAEALWQGQWMPCIPWVYHIHQHFAYADGAISAEVARILMWLHWAFVQSTVGQDWLDNSTQRISTVISQAVLTQRFSWILCIHCWNRESVAKYCFWLLVIHKSFHGKLSNGLLGRKQIFVIK